MAGGGHNETDGEVLAEEEESSVGGKLWKLPQAADNCLEGADKQSTNVYFAAEDNNDEKAKHEIAFVKLVTAIGKAAAHAGKDVAPEVIDSLQIDSGKRSFDEMMELSTEKLRKREKIICDEPINLLAILDDGTSLPSIWLRTVEETIYLDSNIGHVPYVSSASCSGGPYLGADRHGNWVTACRDFLFGAGSFKIARIVADDYSESGSAWFYHKEFVVTCAHVINKIEARKRDILVQLPDHTLIEVEVVYRCPPDKLVMSYKKDVAILKLKSVRHAVKPTSLANLPIGTIQAGEVVWTSKCVAAGILGTHVQHVLQNMLNVGRVESHSEVCTTVSARADHGFSGGPVIDKSLKIMGMIQGGRGVDMKTVAIIPIEEVANVIDIVSTMCPTIPGFPIPMREDSNATTF